ncbi:hypothetical protein EG359_17300 [Chryseobacterium joostei]|uniref:DUF6291 domain-containing protein n=1 Tax=Chryseobacterium joostei TaxID=112234 RepID=A0A1N7IB36_9FLAO|nr:DUF6291 domain-containing protein [Chryseobacterium joostei]AZB01260.1 hypothetical protein EG359_17300 [Chryseobacterium joostei]SIS34240.1 hypothetical protein SAMN05421768_103659 [Chryseobacterium joostei]
MAENKKSFVAYCDWENQLNLLSDDEAGKLFRHLLAYVNDKNPQFSDEERVLKMAFEPIRLQLKRDLDKYEEVKKKRSEAGRNGGLKSGESRSKTKQTKPKEANASFGYKNEANEAVNDNVTVNVNDNVILLKKETKEENIIKKNPEELFDIPPEKEKRKKAPQKKETVNNSEPGIKIFFFKKALIEYGFDDEALVDHFIAVRKKKNLVNTEVAFKNFIREIEKTGKDKNEVFRIVTQKQWGGFEAKWLNNLSYEQTNSFKTKSNGNGLRQSVER